MLTFAMQSSVASSPLLGKKSSVAARLITWTPRQASQVSEMTAELRQIHASVLAENGVCFTELLDQAGLCSSTITRISVDTAGGSARESPGRRGEPTSTALGMGNASARSSEETEGGSARGSPGRRGPGVATSEVRDLSPPHPSKILAAEEVDTARESPGAATSFSVRDLSPPPSSRHLAAKGVDTARGFPGAATLFSVRDLSTTHPPWRYTASTGKANGSGFFWWNRHSYFRNEGQGPNCWRAGPAGGRGRTSTTCVPQRRRRRERGTRKATGCACLRGLPRAQEIRQLRPPPKSWRLRAHGHCGWRIPGTTLASARPSQA